MRMCLLVYCDVADETVIGEIKKAGFRGYTKLEEARGEGTESEPKLGTHCWPGKNNVLMIAAADEKVAEIGGLIRKIKKEHPRAGLKGFLLPVEELV